MVCRQGRFSTTARAFTPRAHARHRLVTAVLSGGDVLAAVLVLWLSSLVVLSVLLALVVAVQGARRALVSGARRPVVE